MATRSRTRKRPAATPANGSAAWAGTLDEWRSRAGPHHVTLPSGMRVAFRVMGLGELMQNDAIPEHLSDLVALHLVNADRGGIDAFMADELVRSHESPEAEAEFRKRLRELAELSKRLAAAALVEPRLTFEELDELVGSSAIPWGDVEELMRLCTGQKAFDSRGVRIGVEPMDQAARFHHHHGLDVGAEDCPGCQAWRRELSSVHIGSL